MCIRDRPNAPLLHKGFQNLFRLGIANIVINLLNNPFKLGDTIPALGIVPVSYTHLDVYKRQGERRDGSDQADDVQAAGEGVAELVDHQGDQMCIRDRSPPARR